jgi:hypothetical protein
VGPGYAYRLGVTVHDNPKQFGPVHHRDSLFLGGYEFGVVFFHRRGIYDQIHGIGYVFRFVAYGDLYIFIYYISGDVCFAFVGTADRITAAAQNFRKSAHADAANADKMHMPGVKVYRLHMALLMYKTFI